MKEYHLQSQNDSIEILKRFFKKIQKIKPEDDLVANIEVNEDICFGLDKWLSIGEIEIHPTDEEPGDEDEYSSIERALKLGSYDWRLPEFETLLLSSVKLMLPSDGSNQNEKEERIKYKASRAVDGVVDTAIRCGLVHPIFDAASFINMPFKRPTTIVADTNSVLHGGLDFVVRFLCPMARIKIPAIVHMEILNFVDRYLTQRRSKNVNKGSMLLDHVNSQGGQRVLLRLELQTDAEIERPRLGADPLRGIVHSDSDPEDKSLNLQVVQRSFADRLILETAIQHRERLSPDHPIMLLTCDQGLARMTLGEGMQPLFFDKNYSSKIFGSVLSGTCFWPFVGPINSNRLYFVPLTELVWELAITFGAARLTNKENNATIEIRAMGEDLSWHPFHAKDDLLWLKWENIDFPDSSPRLDEEERRTMPIDLPGELSPEVMIEGEPSHNQTTKKLKASLMGSYKFSVSSMLLLIHAFHTKDIMTDKEGVEVIGIMPDSYSKKYRNFLRSGEFIKTHSNAFRKTEKLDKLWDALKLIDYPAIRSLLYDVPTFRAFVEELQKESPKTAQNVSSVNISAFPTYCTLAEVSCSGLYISGEGIYKTPYEPLVEDFSSIAMECYKEIAKGEDYILTGKWLEALARKYGIHPITARNRLDEARQAGYLERYTEGSTPETQFEKHTMNYLKLSHGLPVVEKVNFYHGDFLIPDRASVSIRIEGK
ncbi:MAG: hypothetical protein QG588_126 [Candidatus Poribacteria bacterium]|nr:hypothetical protein [Candidatus Poribacteria bacterium]